MTTAFPVAKSAGALIGPCVATPSGSLLLSHMDRNFTPGTFLTMMSVYKHGWEPAKVVGDALSKALVPYYPLAGRLVRSDGGEVEVACTGDGVWFVEASAGCSLEDVGWLLDYPLMIPREELLSIPPDPIGMSIIMQVTQFACGGFVIGVVFDHTMVDGIGMARFLNGVAEAARGYDDLTIKPIWCREAIPSPPENPSEPPLAPRPPSPAFGNRYFHIDISSERISQLKQEFHDQTAGSVCSTFDILTAKAWQCRARVMNFDPDADVSLVVAADVRHLLGQALLPGGAGGYYGNCACPIIVTAASGKIAHASIHEIVNLIIDAKKRMPIEFLKWSRGNSEEDPCRWRIKHDFFIMTDWRRVGFDEVDYGWGKPAYVAPILPENRLAAVAFLVGSPTSEKGVRLVTQCVKEKDLAMFQDQMVNAFNVNAASSSVVSA